MNTSVINITFIHWHILNWLYTNRNWQTDISIQQFTFWTITFGNWQTVSIWQFTFWTVTFGNWQTVSIQQFTFWTVTFAKWQTVISKKMIKSERKVHAKLYIWTGKFWKWHYLRKSRMEHVSPQLWQLHWQAFSAFSAWIDCRVAMQALCHFGETTTAIPFLSAWPALSLSKIP